MAPAQALPRNKRRRTASVLAIAGLLFVAAATTLPGPVDRTDAASASLDTHPLSENAMDTWEVVNADMDSSVVFPALVWAFEEINGVMYVGGRFQQVRSDAGTALHDQAYLCLLYTSPSPRDATLSRMPSSA